MTNVLFANDILEKERTKLAFLPTPIERLERLEKALNGPELWMKRDDLTGLAFGGNKTRKLEYHFAQAIKLGADTVITAGALQSNHCRQTAAAAAKLGLKCHLLIDSEKKELDGNALLDELLGATIHWKREKGTAQTLEDLQQELVEKGSSVYIIHYGGTDEVGVLGFVNAMQEFLEQQKEMEKPFTHIVFAGCSGGTQIGLEVGARLFGFKGEIIGISVDCDDERKEKFQALHAEIANRCAKKLDADIHFEPSDFHIEYAYAKGYAKVGDLERKGIRTLAEKEGILVDPVYSGRAFGALLDMIEKGRFTKEDRVLFWHTGGQVALFPYRKDLRISTSQ